MIIIFGIIAGWILRWYILRRLRKFIRREVNDAIVGIASTRAVEGAEKRLLR